MSNNEVKMSEEEITKLLSKAISESKGSNSDRDKYIDWLFKALIGVLVWVGMGMKDDLKSSLDFQVKIQSTILEMRKDSEHDAEKIQAVTNKLEEPRFTRQNYDLLTLPVFTQVNLNTATLTERAGILEDLTNRILSLEYSEKQKNK